MKNKHDQLGSINLSRLLQYPFHPLLFGVYPILYQMAINISEVSFSYMYRPLLLSLAGVLVFLLFFRAVYRDGTKAALASTILLILFYSYGHVYIALKGISFGSLLIFRHRTLIPLWIGGAGLAVSQIARKSLTGSILTSMFNVAGLFLLIMPSYQLAAYPFQSRLSQSAAEKDTQTLSLNVDGGAPDIYYIILDGYGRSDVLKNEFGYDNSDFLNSLRDIGFYVADCSQSNYAQTQISLASSLNFNYIDKLGDQFIPGTNDRAALAALIKHSALRKSLEAAGYKTVAFATGFDWTQLDDADYYLSPQVSFSELNEFEYLLVDTTLARIILDARLGEQETGSELYRERTLFALDKLDKLSYIKEPKFVFVHLVIPHFPYVFGPTGGPVEPAPAGATQSEQSVMQYRDQAIYISHRMKEIVPQIIAGSATPPILVIQGDHGPTVPGTPQRRMKNLSVYYLPGSNAALYPTITPVNTFRVILNTYFGQHLEMLDDLSLYSSYDDPFRYKPISNSCTKN